MFLSVVHVVSLCSTWFVLNAMNTCHTHNVPWRIIMKLLLCLFRLKVLRMEALSGGTELGSEVSAAINLGAEEHETITLHCSKEGLLSATLVDLKEKCMQVLELICNGIRCLWMNPTWTY